MDGIEVACLRRAEVGRIISIRIDAVRGSFLLLLWFHIVLFRIIWLCLRREALENTHAITDLNLIEVSFILKINNY